MFHFLKKNKPNKTIEIGAPVRGKVIPLDEVKDPAFSEGALGKGAAVVPEEGKIYAPADGVIELLADTLHAVCFMTDEGAEILIHIGLDTVALNGEFFTAHKKTGETVKKGELVIEIDLENVKKAGYDITTPVVVCNTSDYSSVENVAEQDVKPGDVLLAIMK